MMMVLTYTTEGSFFGVMRLHQISTKMWTTIIYIKRETKSCQLQFHKSTTELRAINEFQLPSNIHICT